MATIDQLKTEFEKRSISYSEEFTSGNYDDDGKIINEKIPTLTTEFCEIGFHKTIVYLVFIAKSDSWSSGFLDEIKKFLNLQIYGLKKFEKNYNLAKNPESEIKSEPYFQMQFNFDVNKISVYNLLEEYDKIIQEIKKYNISVVNQLDKTTNN